MEEYKRNEQDLYANTDNGLDILKKYIPDFVLNKNFCYREEKNPSSRAYKSNTGIWYIKDFGGGSHFPLQIVMEQMGLSYYDALVHLYAEFQIPVSGRASLPQNKTFKEKGDLPNDYFNIAVKNITNEKEFSRFVTPELLVVFNIYEVEYYERITSNGKLMRVDSTPYYPIFVYSPDITQWAKLYCPAEKKGKTTLEDGTEKRYNYKHGYLGKKPEKYFHGLDRIKAEYSEEKIKAIDNYREILKRTSDKEVKAETQKALDDMLLPYVIICSGGSDGVSIASLSSDFYPIWGNSESDIITEDVYSFLRKISKNLIYLPDVDKAGIEFAYAYSHRYWKLDVVFLQKYYMGKNGKDFRDFINFFNNETSKEIICEAFKKMLNVPVNFNIITLNDRKQHRISVSNFHYFLNANNYFVYISPNEKSNTNENQGTLLYENGYILENVTGVQIEEFCRDFLIRKGTTKKITDYLKSSNFFSDKELKKVPSKNFNLTKFDKDHQMFFFENTAVKVTANNIFFLSNKDVQNYVFKENIIKRNISKQKETFFEPYKDEKGNNRVKILFENCDFLNYLINTSRVFWEKDYLEHEKNNKKWGEIHTLSSKYLTEEEQITQEQHFLSKCYAIGYMLHRWNDVNFPVFVYVTDDQLKENNNEANGGTGKSMFAKGIEQLAKFFHPQDCGKKDILDDKHIFGGLKDYHDVIFFDDVNQNQDFRSFYTLITRGITPNTKNVQQERFFSFDERPKIMGTFNYGLKDNSSAGMRRVFFVSFSSYYHKINKTMGREYQPYDDFKKRFYVEWNTQEWNYFFNFMLRCCQFYIANQNSPYYAPLDNLKKNNLKAIIGNSFLEWAEDYFSDDSKFENNINKKEIVADCKVYCAPVKMTSQAIKTKLEQFCSLKGYSFSGDIAKYEFVGQTRTTVKYFCFSKKTDEIDLPTSEPTSEPTSANNTTIDECDFWADNEDLKF